MRPYEVPIIFDPALDDEVIRAALDRFVELVRSRGGHPGRIDRWGKRRLAYEIARHAEGYYAILEMTAEPPVVDDLDRALRLADEVLRHKIVRLPDRVAGRGARTASVAAPEAASQATT